MDLLEYITEEEKDIINEWRYADKEVSSALHRYYGRDILASVDKTLSEWSAQKETLFHLFDDNLIISRNITVNKNLEMLAEECRKVLRNNPFRSELINQYDKINEKIRYENKNEEWGKGLSVNSLIMQLISPQVLVRNKIGEASGKLIFIETGHSIQFNENTKPMRILTKIVEELDLPHFEEFRLLVSQVLNNKKYQGELCLSIHPLDFMTMSNNECGWSSCMSWGDHAGVYRGGVVEMMNSPIVVEAYLRSNSDMHMPGDYYWSNKKWRELFVVSHECLLGIKGYPYDAKEIENIVMEWLAELAEKNFNWHFEEPTVQTVHNMKTIFETKTMYNDVYGERLVSFTTDDIPIPEAICYSGQRSCMICGEVYETDYGWDDSESDCAHITCGDCSPFVVCDCCGYPVYWDDIEEVDGESLCQACYDELRFCACCDNPLFPREYECTHREYMVTVDGIYNWNYAVPFCDDCITSGEIIPVEKLQEIVTNLQYYETAMLYIDYNDLTPKGKEIVDDYFSGRGVSIKNVSSANYVLSTSVRPLTTAFAEYYRT